MPLELPKQLTASGLVLRWDRTVLLVEHPKLRAWLYPGGHVEAVETPDQAVIREVAEEAGVQAYHLGSRHTDLEERSAGVRALPTPYLVMCERVDDPKTPHDHLDLIYLCGTRNRAAAAGGGVTAAGFFTETEAMQLNLLPAFRRLLTRVYRDGRAWDLLETTEVSS